MWSDYAEFAGKVYDLYEEYGAKWCQDCNAKDAEGNACEWQSEKATSFCLLGAIYKVYQDSPLWSELSKHLATVLRPFWEGQLLEWNDKPNRTYEEVLKFVKEHNL